MTESEIDEPELESIDLENLTTDDIERIQRALDEVRAQREHETDLDDKPSVELVNGKWVKWADLSAHANRKAVKAWILRITGTHDTYGVDGDWLNKQQIDGQYHMDVSDIEAGEYIKVSGASHSNKKHRYYRVIAITDHRLYYEPERGLTEANVIEAVS